MGPNKESGFGGNPTNVTAMHPRLTGTATAYDTAPDDAQYAVCTTIQYEYKPSQNTATLMVEPPKTDATAAKGNEPPTQSPEGTTVSIPPPKTPEQMEQEAKNSRWLTTWHEFTWWYPWYRMHVVGKYNGETMIDVGIAVLPFADTAYFPDTPLQRKVNEWFSKVLWNVLLGVVATEFALWLGSHFGLLYFAIALGLYIGYKFLNLLTFNWNSVESLFISLVSTVTSLAISAWTGLCSFLPSSLRALAAGAESIKNAAFAFICKIIMIPVNLFLLIMTWNRIVALGGV